jgi:hypothetical protein
MELQDERLPGSPFPNFVERFPGVACLSLRSKCRESRFFGKSRCRWTNER